MNQTKTLDGIYLDHFLSILLGDKDSAPCLQYIALKIKELDPTEDRVHIELANTELNTTDSPIVWKARAWSESSVRYYRRKQLSAMENEKHFMFKDILKTIIKRLQVKTGGLDEDSCMKIALSILEDKNRAMACTIWGIDSSVLDAADKRIQEFKQQSGFKV